MKREYNQRDLTGRRFGRLVVLQSTDEVRYKQNNKVWKCLCDCGNEAFVAELNLVYKSSNTKSCGCLHTESARIASKKRTDKTISHIAKKITEFAQENNFKEGTSLPLLTSKVSKANKSGTKGVSWSNKQGKWVAAIGFKGKQLYLGSFENIEDAIFTRKEAEEKYFKPILEKYGKEQKQ